LLGGFPVPLVDEVRKGGSRWNLEGAFAFNVDVDHVLPYTVFLAIFEPCKSLFLFSVPAAFLRGGLLLLNNS
jgi:hypothetical protein